MLTRVHNRTAWLAAVMSLALLPAAAGALEPGKAKTAARHKQAARTLPAAQAPLRFEAPAAGPGAANAAYDDCIDHPSPDGLTMDCQALRQPVATKTRRKR